MHALIPILVALSGTFTFAAQGTLKDGKVRYDGHSIVRVLANTTDDARILSSFQDKLNLDVWSNGGGIVVGQNDIRMTADELKQLPSLPHEIFIKDVQQLIDLEARQLHNTSRDPNPAFYTAYHTYDEIAAYVRTLAERFPSLAYFVESIGETIEGLPIPAIVIGPAEPKKRVFFSGGQHAREWIAPITVVYIIESLLTDYATDPQVQLILDNVRFVIVPQVNLDGYAYSWATDRLWRKNRRQNVGTVYYGVDLNRNWNDHWGGVGSSPNPSAETYRGTAAFSEPESTFVSEFFTANGPFDASIDWHSYSQLILRPSGWTNVPSPDDAVNKAVGDEIRQQILSVHGIPYTSQPSWALYYTTGTAQDWYYGQGNSRLSFTIELRDTGNYGFVLPPAQIIPTGQENYAAVLFLGSFLVEEI